MKVLFILTVIVGLSYVALSTAEKTTNMLKHHQLALEMEVASIEQ